MAMGLALGGRGKIGASRPLLAGEEWRYLTTNRAFCLLKETSKGCVNCSRATETA